MRVEVEFVDEQGRPAAAGEEELGLLARRYVRALLQAAFPGRAIRLGPGDGPAGGQAQGIDR